MRRQQGIEEESLRAASFVSRMRKYDNGDDDDNNNNNNNNHLRQILPYQDKSQRPATDAKSRCVQYLWQNIL